MPKNKTRQNKKHSREEIATCASVNDKIDIKASEFVVATKISPQILTRLSDFLIHLRKIPVPC